MHTITDQGVAALPDKYTLIEASHGLTVKVRWFRFIHLFTLTFAVIWMSFIVVFYSRLVGGDAPIMVYLFPALHILFGVCLLYYALCGIVNITRIDVNPQDICIRHIPFPWKTSRTILRQNINLLHITEQYKTLKGMTFLTYDIQVITSDECCLTLIKGLECMKQARHIEKRIQQFLAEEELPGREALAS